MSTSRTSSARRGHWGAAAGRSARACRSGFSRARGSLQGVEVAERADQPARALVGLGFGRLVAAGFQAPALALGQAARAAFFRFGIEGLGDLRRAALLAERAHLDLVQLAGARDFQLLADAQRPCGLEVLAADGHAPGLDRGLGERTRLEEARGPQPQVEAGGGGCGGMLFHGPERKTAAEATVSLHAIAGDYSADGLRWLRSSLMRAFLPCSSRR